MTSTTLCPGCGRAIEAGWTFCPACGRTVSGSPRRAASERGEVSQLAPITLTALGLLVALLGLFAAGSVELVVVGLAAIFAAGLLEVLSSRSL